MENYKELVILYHITLHVDGGSGAKRAPGSRCRQKPKERRARTRILASTGDGLFEEKTLKLLGVKPRVLLHLLFVRK